MFVVHVLLVCVMDYVEGSMKFDIYRSGAVSLSCVLSKLLQSLTFCSKLFFQIFVNFPPKHFNFLLLNPASQKLK